MPSTQILRRWHQWRSLWGGRDRKRAIEQLLARTALQDAEENAVLEQAAVVEGARRAEAAARKAAAAPPRPCAPPEP